MGKLRVKHCLVSLTTRQYGPHPTSDLLGVDYFRMLPADTEFPRRLGMLEVFVRLIGDDGISGSIWVTMAYLNPDGSDRQLVYRKRFVLPTATGPVVLDKGYKLANVVVPGEGTYAVRVQRRVRRRWAPEATWRLLGVDHISIRRAP